MSNVTPINPEAVTGDPARVVTAATVPDHADAFLADMARDLALETLELAERDGGAHPQGDAVAVLLLAVVELTRDMKVHGRERAIAGMLAQAVGEALDAYEEPTAAEWAARAQDAAGAAKAVRIVPPAEARARLQAAMRAAMRPDGPTVGGEAA